MIGFFLSGQVVLAGGITLVTHGFSGDITSWIVPMAERMSGHPDFPGTQITCYSIEIKSSGGGYRYDATRLVGPAPDQSDSGEIAIKLDWSSIASTLGTSSTDVAEAAATALLDPALLGELNGRPLVELPLHFLGHSRGSSVISELARELGERGVWVDHLSFLDPVPVALYGDAPVKVFENVLFADNFYQTLGGFLTPTGSAVSGSFNRKLTHLSGGYSGFAANHYDPHLWYHGTIELTTPADDSQADISASERNSWWTDAESSGASAGFHFSRIGRGDRLSNTIPANDTDDAIHDGYNRLWDLGAGTGNNRSLVPGKSEQWPNIITCRRLGSGSIPAGGMLSLALNYQCSSEDATLTVFLDPDRNPWNGNEHTLSTSTLPGTGPSNVFALDLDDPIPPATSGHFAIGTHIEQAGRSRFLYGADSLEVTTPPPVINGTSHALQAGLLTLSIIGSPGQQVRIEASSNLVDWVPIGTETLVASSLVFSDLDSPAHARRFYRFAWVPPVPD
jgi:hypothetical protein